MNWPISMAEEIDRSAPSRKLRRCRARAIESLRQTSLRTALRLKRGRGEITATELKTALRDLQADITAGRLEKPAHDLVAVFHKAGELSAKYAASTLVRSLHILHVAAVLTLGARVFVSFDDRQRKIARRARLKVLPRIRP